MSRDSKPESGQRASDHRRLPLFLASTSRPTCRRKPLYHPNARAYGCQRPVNLIGRVGFELYRIAL